MTIKNFEANAEKTKYTWKYFQDTDPEKGEKHPTAVCTGCDVPCSIRGIASRRNTEGKPVSRDGLNVTLNATAGTTGDNLISAAKNGNIDSNFACGVLPRILKSQATR